MGKVCRCGTGRYCGVHFVYGDPPKETPLPQESKQENGARAKNRIKITRSTKPSKRNW